MFAALTALDVYAYAGRRWSTTPKEFFAIATAIGGPRLADFITDNIGGPRATTVSTTRAAKHTMQLGREGVPATAQWLASFYAEVLHGLGHAPGTVMFQLSVDETVIQPSLCVSDCGGFLLGSCGLKGTIEAPHVCRPLRIPIGNGVDGYNDVCKAVDEYVVSHCK